MGTASSENNVIIDDRTIVEDADISIHFCAGDKLPDEEDFYVTQCPFTEEDASRVVAAVASFTPKIEGQNDISPLMRKELAQAFLNVARHAYRLGAVSGFEHGYWSCDEFFGCPLGEDITDSIVERILGSATRGTSDFEDAVDGWYENSYILSKVGVDDIVRFAQSHWMGWKEALGWLSQVRRIIGGHVHISKMGEVYDPSGVFEELLAVFDIFDMEYSLGIAYVHDAVDLFASHSMLDAQTAEEYKIQISQERLSLMRDGIPIEDIFA